MLTLFGGKNICPAFQIFPGVLRKKKKIAAAWQYSRKLITQERIYEGLYRLLFFTCFGTGKIAA